MANVDSPNGFWPSRHLQGGVIRASEYEIADAYNANIFSGDVVKLATTDYIQVAAAGDTNLIGVFQGVQWTASDGEVKFSRYWPASTSVKSGTKIKAFVYDDPNIAFAVQTLTGTSFTQAMSGGNVDIKAEHTGSTSTGQSGMEADISTVVTTTANLRVIKLIDKPDNALGEHAKIEVLLLEHLMRPAGTTGI
jgi:hypothetical protein